MISQRRTSMIGPLNRMSLLELLSWFDMAPMTLPAWAIDTEQVWLTEIAMLIGSSGRQGVWELRERLPTLDEMHLSAALFGLGFLSGDDVDLTEILHQYISDERPAVAAQAIDTADVYGGQDLVEEVLRQSASASPLVRASVLRFISHHVPHQLEQEIERAFQEGSAILLLNAIDEIEGHGLTRFLPQIAALAHHPNETVRAAAADVMRHLASMG